MTSNKSLSDNVDTFSLRKAISLTFSTELLFDTVFTVKLAELPVSGSENGEIGVLASSNKGNDWVLSELTSTFWRLSLEKYSNKVVLVSYLETFGTNGL